MRRTGSHDCNITKTESECRLMSAVYEARIIVDKRSDRSNVGDQHSIDLRFRVLTLRDLEKAFQDALTAARALPNGTAMSN
jgi:hypothetical protein